MGIKSLLMKAGGKVGDVIAKGSALSPAQLKEIDSKKNAFLTEFAKKNPNSDEANEFTSRVLAAIGVEIYNAYLPQIKEFYKPVDVNAEYSGSFDFNHNVRYVNITKWVTDKKENNLEKLVNVYEVLSKEECNIALVFDRKMSETNVYLAVINTKNSNSNIDANLYIERLKSAIKGNFPGSDVSEKYYQGRIPFMDKIGEASVACISNMPAEKSEKFNTQTIEKLLDGIIPESDDKEYTLVLLATPIQDVAVRKFRLGEYYSTLNPYQAWDTNFVLTESSTVSAGSNVGINLGGSAGVQAGTNESISKAVTDAVSKSTTKLGSGTIAQAAGGAVGGALGGAKIGGVIGSIIPGAGTALGAGIGAAFGGLIGTIAAAGSGLALTNNEGTSHSETTTNTTGTYNGINKGINFGANFARSSNTTAIIGKNEGLTQKFVNYNIKHTLEILEEQMKRMEQSTALGLWDFAAYVISNDENVANNVAHSYLALTQGEKSYMSDASVNVWRGDLAGKGSDDAKEIIEYLKDLRHPIFGLNPDIINDDPTFNVYPTIITATTALSGKELAYSLNFPKKSISGLPVFECAEFGRNITSYNLVDNNKEKISIGNIYHMHHEEKNVPVELLNESLASHTFITGSTGSGKSNTVYEILNEACEKNIKFLVIEPTKGEYKNIFGSRKDVSVFGTNPEFTKLLRINPFSFPKGIHVFEHMDRLVEIFNVCWPMYAAMPAVLKNAIEKSYEDCGWDLTKSTNEYGDNLYPTFNDVARNIKQIIDSSEYDNENKGAYKGSLLTRLQSLTNGINGLAFTSKNETPLEKLFDNNAIVDISRVGSNETKSLLMGMLVLKLQEYRIVNHNENNEKIHHLTVIEEAHNLLKRTSTEQPVEGGNLLGKSVEMISNAIAEMRTYGEGFIIVDQAPGLLDMAAIRNTNTKIIMRLPDEMDRKLVGKAANLNDDQIIELAKLPKGVAAIYQNEWIQPVLCKIKKYGNNGSKFIEKEDIEEESKNIDDIIDIATLLSNGTKIVKTKEKEIKEKLLGLKLDASVQVAIIDSLRNPLTEPRMTKLAPIMNALFPELTNSFVKVYKETDDKTEWTKSTERALQDIINKDIEDQVRRDIIQASITYYLYNVMSNELVLKQWINDGGLK